MILVVVVAGGDGRWPPSVVASACMVGVASEGTRRVRYTHNKRTAAPPLRRIISDGAEQEGA